MAAAVAVEVDQTVTPLEAAGQVSDEVAALRLERDRELLIAGKFLAQALADGGLGFEGLAWSHAARANELSERAAVAGG